MSRENHIDTFSVGGIGVKVNLDNATKYDLFLSSSGPGPVPRSGPGQVPGQVQKVQGPRTKDLDLGKH